MSDDIFLELLAEDKHTITYRPRLASFTNSALAAILLQQILYWWKKSDKKPFFKFRVPSNHKKYQSGDSWCEELELNPHEFDGALKIIGTKITKGISKADMLKTSMPIRKDGETDQEFYDRLKVAVSRCVIYWTDSNRITWYFLNAQLLGNFVSRIYLDNSYSLKYLKSAILASTYKNRKPASTSKTETNTETTAEGEAVDNDVIPVVNDAPILLPEMLPSKHTPLREPQAKRSEIPPTPIAAAPLPQNYRALNDSFESLHPFLEIWRQAHPGIKPSIPRTQRENYQTGAQDLQAAGVTAQDVKDFVLHRLEKSQSTAWTFIVSDIHVFLAGRKPKSSPIQFPTYVPPPQAAPVSADAIERIKAELAEESAS